MEVSNNNGGVSKMGDIKINSKTRLPIFLIAVVFTFLISAFITSSTDASPGDIVCIDYTDGGNNIYVRGSTLYAGFTREEYCNPTNTHVNEFYCGKPFPIEDNWVECPIGYVCDTGACIEDPNAPVCGDGAVEGLEECETSGTYSGWGPSPGAWPRSYQYEYACEDAPSFPQDTYAYCDPTTCTYVHVDICKERCSADWQCEGIPPNTEGCSFECEWKPWLWCGDGTVDTFEECEPPNDDESSYCPQSSEDCVGKKTRYRDSFGDCD